MQQAHQLRLQRLWQQPLRQLQYLRPRQHRLLHQHQLQQHRVVVE
jgi:hypothetical protein